MNNNTTSNNRTADMILVFPDAQKRMEFFESDSLNTQGVLYETFNSLNEVAVTNVNVVVCAEIIAEAMKYGGKHILNCGGKNLSDCAKYEKNCGSICDYCQYMELDLKSNGDNL